MTSDAATVAETTTCVIVGGGPAGMIAGLILARGGVAVTVLEKHADFLRDFRGDTVHPSTLSVLDELGLYERFAALPQSTVARVGATLPDGRFVTVADFTRLPVPHPRVALVPQWDLLDLLAEAGRDEDLFTLRMSHETTGVLREGVRIVGVGYTGPDGPGELRADLVLACDGRWSRSREAAGLTPRDHEVATDLWWFRLPAVPGVVETLAPRFGGDRFLILIPREGYLQCGLSIPKGSDATRRAHGVEALQREITELAPDLADVTGALTDMDDVKLLDIRISALRRWYVDGLLCLGDAAHAMSPLGGIGINLAVQDAVAAASMLAAPLREGRLTTADLRRVQRRRATAVALTQFGQRRAHALAARGGSARLQRAVRLLLGVVDRAPALSVLPARMIGMGLRPEHAPYFARR